MQELVGVGALRPFILLAGSMNPRRAMYCLEEYWYGEKLSSCDALACRHLKWTGHVQVPREQLVQAEPSKEGNDSDWKRKYSGVVFSRIQGTGWLEREISTFN